jgi:hypothetical protein
VQRLHELGWIEGRTIAIEYRRSERFAEIAAELVRLKVDVIVTGQSSVPALKQVTSVIPIVMAVANDPVGGGLVATLARPGGNVTGLSLQTPDLAGKRLELLREVVPGLRRLAVLANVANAATVPEMGEVAAAARTLGLEVVTLGVRRAEDSAPAFEAHKGRADALYVTTDGLLNTNRIRINRSDQRSGAGDVRPYSLVHRISGLGPIIATAIATTVADPNVFRSGREFAAWLGLVPRQNSTGGKIRLGGITKRGNRYLRRLLINGASANLLRSKATKADPWVIGLRRRRPPLVVAVALANKTARIAWAVMLREKEYRPRAMAA